MPTATVYGIPNCDTVRKARAWLADAGIQATLHDFKKDGVPPQALDEWLQAFGWERVLNRAGTTWRKLDDATRASVVDAAGARELMLAQPSVIKRPVVRWHEAGTWTLGFGPDFGPHFAGRR